MSRDTVDDLDPGGRSLPHFAAGYGHLDIVKLLLARKCKLEVRDMDEGAGGLGDPDPATRIIELLRIEAVKQKIRRKGEVAPLKTKCEFATGKTFEEIDEFMCNWENKVWDKHDRACGGKRESGTVAVGNPKEYPVTLVLEIRSISVERRTPSRPFVCSPV